MKSSGRDTMFYCTDEDNTIYMCFIVLDEFLTKKNWKTWYYPNIEHEFKKKGYEGVITVTEL